MNNLGILLVNVGTPAHADIRSVRKYLAEFLSDPRMIQLPKLLWWPILHGFILRTRPRYSAHNYQQIWTKEGSPLLVASQQLAKKLIRNINLSSKQTIKIALGMRYGKPSIAEGLKQLAQESCQKILILPMFPQYSGATTASIFDAVAAALKSYQVIPEIRMIHHYCYEESYIETLAHHVKSFWLNSGKQHHLLFSFHGIPKAYVNKGDPYEDQCQHTVKLLAETLNLNKEQWSLAFQSRLGRTEWLQPYTDKFLQDLPNQGIKHLDIFCPGFAVDCLETLEEIAIRNKNLFLKKGGCELRYIPALNDSDAHIAMLTTIALKNMQGWIG